MQVYQLVNWCVLLDYKQYHHSLMVFRHNLIAMTPCIVSTEWKEAFWQLQINPAGIWYLAIAVVVSITVSGILFQYKKKGIKILVLLERGEITEPSGLGSWYANNITANASAMLYSIAHYGLIPLSFWFTVLMLAPLDFPALLDATWVALPIFLAIGCVEGIPVQRRWLGIVDPECNDETDGMLD